MILGESGWGQFSSSGLLRTRSVPSASSAFEVFTCWITNQKCNQKELIKSNIFLMFRFWFKGVKIVNLGLYDAQNQVSPSLGCVCVLTARVTSLSIFGLCFKIKVLYVGKLWALTFLLSAIKRMSTEGSLSVGVFSLKRTSLQLSCFPHTTSHVLPFMLRSLDCV